MHAHLHKQIHADTHTPTCSHTHMHALTSTCTSSSCSALPTAMCSDSSLQPRTLAVKFYASAHVLPSLYAQLLDFALVLHRDIFTHWLSPWLLQPSPIGHTRRISDQCTNAATLARITIISESHMLLIFYLVVAFKICKFCMDKGLFSPLLLFANYQENFFLCLQYANEISEFCSPLFEKGMCKPLSYDWGKYTALFLVFFFIVKIQTL